MAENFGGTNREVGVGGGTGTGRASMRIEAHRIEANEHAVGGMSGLGANGGQSLPCVCRKGFHVAWDAKYKFHVQLPPEQISDNLFVFQKLTLDSVGRNFSNRETQFKTEIEEVFRVQSDGWTDEDPHWFALPYPEYCYNWTEETGELSLVRIDPHPDWGVPPDGFMQFKRSLATKKSGEKKWDTEDQSAGLASEPGDYLITPVTGGYGSYSAKYNPEHCREVPWATSGPDAPPPDSGGRTPTPPDGGGAPEPGTRRRGTPTGPGAQPPPELNE